VVSGEFPELWHAVHLIVVVTVSLPQAGLAREVSSRTSPVTSRVRACARSDLRPC
jgi:hypothetical protein